MSVEQSEARSLETFTASRTPVAVKAAFSSRPKMSTPPCVLAKAERVSRTAFGNSRWAFFDLDIRDVTTQGAKVLDRLLAYAHIMLTVMPNDM
ncbi:hypothetical protein ABGB14_21935 [Nonomuraea sp. B10E15]|uniref:hypothetical protein n=1 Tax=Nonomuraea sp. B10E15 TaxID=3153560 RepID=UPI00325C92EA